MPPILSDNPYPYFLAFSYPLSLFPGLCDNPYPYPLEGMTTPLLTYGRVFMAGKSEYPLLVTRFGPNHRLYDTGRVYG
jgi:hypothetical protein